jgi:hypothetical protein
MQDILKDVFIRADEIDRYFTGVTPVNLWRASRVGEPGPIFGLVEEGIDRPGGQFRPADITIEIVQGGKWVRCVPSPRGISTFDRPDTFRGKTWLYYKIPAGTKIPYGLAIIKDGYNGRLSATHYTIAPAWDMPLDHFKALLNALAHSTILEVA